MNPLNTVAQANIHTHGILFVITCIQLSPLFSVPTLRTFHIQICPLVPPFLRSQHARTLPQSPRAPILATRCIPLTVHSSSSLHLPLQPHKGQSAPSSSPGPSLPTFVHQLTLLPRRRSPLSTPNHLVWNPSRLLRSHVAYHLRQEHTAIRTLSLFIKWEVHITNATLIHPLS